MIAVDQLRRLVVRPCLTYLDLWSQAAENLLIGTAVHESGLRYLAQLGGGLARGIYQVEPATHDDLWVHFLPHHRALADKISALAAPFPSRREQLATNLGYATAITRMVYFRRPEPLPAATDIQGLARYWKRFFNTKKGLGTVPGFILNYKEHVR